MALALEIPEPEALAAVQGAADTLSRAQTLATAVTTPARWGAPDMSFRPGIATTDRIVARIQDRIRENDGRDLVRSRWLGGLAAGLAVSQVEGTVELHEVALGLDEDVTAAAGRVASAPLPAVLVGRCAGEADGRADAAATDLLAVSTASPDLSHTAAGAVLGSIVRPEAEAGRANHAPASDRERLDRFRTPQGTVLATWVERAARITVTDVRMQLAALVEAPGALALGVHAPT